MKKYILIISLLITSINFIYGQQINTEYNGNGAVWYYNWSDSQTFTAGPQPTIFEYGELSDSLSTVFNGVKFYEYSGEYFAINSWADYYLWFTYKYWYLFDKPNVEYEYFYATGNNFGMASYVAGSYIGKYYPTSFILKFTDPSIENKLKNLNYIAIKDREIEGLKKGLKESFPRTAKISSFQEYANFSKANNDVGRSSKTSTNGQGLNYSKKSKSKPVKPIKYGLKETGGSKKSKAQQE